MVISQTNDVLIDLSLSLNFNILSKFYNSIDRSVHPHDTEVKVNMS